MTDRITGGGFMSGTPRGAKGNFGVADGVKNGAYWGHLNFSDRGTGMHVKHIAITDCESTSPRNGGSPERAESTMGSPDPTTRSA